MSHRGALVLFLVLVLIASAAFAAGYALATKRLRRGDPEVAAPVRLSDPALVAPSRVVFVASAVEGTPEWRGEMSDLGARMRAAGVRLVVFAHGSFVGDDPLALARAVEGAVPALPNLARAVRGFTRAQVSRFLGDLSTFSSEYIAAFAQATGVEVLDFGWSGENHHVARIQGAARLSRSMALHGGGALRDGDRVLLMGHSHAGQIFAVLSQLVARAQGYEQIVEAARARGEDPEALEDHLGILRRCSVDVATFGTPPRYGWAAGAGFRLLHVVNHRGAALRAPSLRGILHTSQGDYIQQLGAHGSDLPATTSREREMNASLDGILGVGRNLRLWMRHVAHGLRVSPHGHTVLVDYGDGSQRLPNFWATGLGHAAYTRRHAMLFHTRLVASHFYPPRPADPWGDRVREWIDPRRLLPPKRRSPES